MKTLLDSLLYGIARGLIKYPEPKPAKSPEAIKKQLKRYKHAVKVEPK